MRLLCAFLFFTCSLSEPNIPVKRVDIKKYSGTWYSLYSIPTVFDKGSRETTTKYTLNKDGYYDVTTTYKKAKDEKIRSVTSKIFPNEDGEDAKMKCQFLWPVKLDYWIIELADDYSYVVVGHPDHKFLFIMSRTPKMNKNMLEGIMDRCRNKGYEVSKLTSQMHEQ